jgi:hypothetical protein
MNRFLTAICASVMIVTAGSPAMATATTIGGGDPISPTERSVINCDRLDRLEGLCGKPPRQECEWLDSCGEVPRRCWDGPDPSVVRERCKDPCEEVPTLKRCVHPDTMWDELNL